MEINVQDELEKLEKQILTKNISKIASTTEEWGGADVIIRKKMDEKIKSWVEEKCVVISLQDTEPRRRVVITEYSRELSWLFNKLNYIFADKIDYISKYDFYGSLAQSAIDYLDGKKENKNVNDLLITVLNTSKGVLE